MSNPSDTSCHAFRAEGDPTGTGWAPTAHFSGPGSDGGSNFVRALRALAIGSTPKVGAGNW